MATVTSTSKKSSTRSGSTAGKSGGSAKKSQQSSSSSKPAATPDTVRAAARANTQRTTEAMVQRLFGSDQATVGSEAQEPQQTVEETRPGLLDGLFSWANNEPEQTARQDETTAGIRPPENCVAPEPPGGMFFSLPQGGGGTRFGGNSSGNSELGSKIVNTNAQMMEDYLERNPDWEQEQAQKWANYHQCLQTNHDALASFLLP